MRLQGSELNFWQQVFLLSLNFYEEPAIAALKADEAVLELRTRLFKPGDVKL